MKIHLHIIKFECVSYTQSNFPDHLQASYIVITQRIKLFRIEKNNKLHWKISRSYNSCSISIIEHTEFYNIHSYNIVFQNV